jgi:trehalose 6-phosphate phosphatase
VKASEKGWSTSITIDPRRHDAVLFQLDAPHTESIATLVQRLQGIGVGADELAHTGNPKTAVLVEAANRLGARPGRCVVVAEAGAGVTAGRDGGFALVVGVDRAGRGDELSRHGADAVVRDVREITVRTGDRRMSELPDAIEALADATNSAFSDRQSAVFFDFDGTLSDIVNDPGAARLTAGAAEALRLLTTRRPVAVLSGRDLADVRQRIGLPGIWYAGSHGFELIGPGGEHHQNEAAATAVPVLEELASELRDKLGAIAGVAVEHKRFGVAVHYRNAARDRVGEVAAAVRAAGRRSALRVTTGREVIELRPNVDWDKGKTLRWVVDQIRDAESESLSPIYLGDDITDEDAFDAVHDDGIGIVVRHTEDGDRATAAQFALDSPARVSEFTKRLAQQIGAGVDR